MSFYYAFCAVGLLLFAVLTCVRAKSCSLANAALLFILSLLCSFAFARGGYAILQYSVYASQYQLCLTLGILGTALSSVLCSYILHKSPAVWLDGCAPLLCLVMAFCRFAQYWLGSIGLGMYIGESGLLCRFPFAKVNSWAEWYLCTSTLEALCALFICFISAKYFAKDKRSGIPFLRTLYWLLFPQILFEQLRSGHAMQWRMVRAEQVVIAVILLFILIRIGKEQSRKNPLTIIAFLICVAIIVIAQFALDGKLPLPQAVSWGLYLLAVFSLPVIETLRIKNVQ